MDLDFNKDQLMVKKAARKFLENECPTDPYVRDVEKGEIVGREPNRLYIQ